ncbi:MULTISPECIES: aldose epimerase family protein [unclassified Fusibacter]|uniref:aldose epimerase family protein n=1 Tax=unclassified Fusibacter TaxID=2624464 RepID=UPI0010139006|nr:MULTISPECIES: aldose epimerase family protein [unclassified Fusibacter]MCK8060069.1 galactose mutarotase [Fusibacter sp. A2]NPE22211.1 galactose mutarotase [Fusibacter sp. A1]RXV60986.1 galactose mutarotase [Fusibacter sp. A1]
MSIIDYGTTETGDSIKEITIGDRKGFHVKVITLGATITDIHTKDLHGCYENIVLGYDTLEDYLKDCAYMGATIGRTAGRINSGEQLKDTSVSTKIRDWTAKLEKNQGPNHLHGGSNGFHHRIWTIDDVKENQVTLSLVDGFKEGSLPGNLTVKAKFEITKEQTLSVSYTATTDECTYVNLTNHSYFNLSGKQCSVGGHDLKVAASYFASTDEFQIPLEDLCEVKGTPFDFTEKKSITSALNDDHSQLRLAGGIDHPFKLDQMDACIVYSDTLSKRKMTISADQEYVVIYTGNFLDEASFHAEKHFIKHQGICFETQDIPNAPNRKGFNRLLYPEKTYHNEVSYTFSVE